MRLEKVKHLTYLLALFPNSREVCLNALKALKRRGAILTVSRGRSDTLVALTDDGTANLKKLPYQTRLKIAFSYPNLGGTYAKALKALKIIEGDGSKKHVKITFSQPWAKKEFGPRVRDPTVIGAELLFK